MNTPEGWRAWRPRPGISTPAPAVSFRRVRRVVVARSDGDRLRTGSGGKD
jgi:hypothetical protein